MAWDDCPFFFLACRARHLQFAKQIQDKVPSWASLYSRSHKLVCYSINLSFFPLLSFLLFLFFLCLSELTAQLFLQAIHLLNCLLMKPCIYLYAWETSCLDCFRLPTSWQTHLSYLFGAWIVRWLWVAKIMEQFLFDTNKNDNETTIRKSSRKQFLNKNPGGIKHCYLRLLVFYFKG